MFDALWKNLHVATFDEADGYGIIEDAAIGIRDGRIAFVGRAFDLPETAQDSLAIYDGRGQWATPGLIDCHTHLVYAGNRAAEFERRLSGDSYQSIAQDGGGVLATMKATREATEEELYDLALQRFKCLFSDGVTAVDIKSGYGLSLESEQKMLRVATRLRDETGITVQRSFLAAHAVPPEFKGRPDDYIDHVCRDMLPALSALRLIDAVDAFCDKMGFTPAQVSKLFATAHALDLPVKIHADQFSNANAAATGAAYKALSADHLEYLDEDGAARMAKSGTVAVLLPGAYYMLREKQRPPVGLLRRHDIPMAVATDHNPGTSPLLSLLTALNMAAVLFELTPLECLQGATIHAARAMGLEAERGSLAVGKKADIAFWKISHPRDLVLQLGAKPCTGIFMDKLFFSLEDAF